MKSILFIAECIGILQVNSNVDTNVSEPHVASFFRIDELQLGRHQNIHVNL